MNPFEMLKQIKNPQEFVMNYLKENSNPMLSNLVDMAQKGDKQSLENTAMNILKQQGANDKDIQSIMNFLK